MSDSLDEEMEALVAEARQRPPAGSTAEAPDEELPVRSADELRTVLKKFRRAMGSMGNPGAIEADVALRAGWIISSGKVEGYGEDVFHVFMLTNGAIFYFSGDTTPPVEFTGKWFLGDSIPALEAKIPATVARIMAEHGADWPATPSI